MGLNNLFLILNMSKNVNPTLFYNLKLHRIKTIAADNECSNRQRFDSLEIFNHVRFIYDPEHQLTLEQLNVISIDHIKVEDNMLHSTCFIEFIPTIPHCSMATLIGLSLIVKLRRCLPPRFKNFVRISPGTHVQEKAINRQLEDKERVYAALENPKLIS